MPLTPASTFFANHHALTKVCGHNGCQKPLGPRVDGRHQEIEGKPVCDDCFWDEFGDEIDQRPIGRGIPHVEFSPID